MAGLIAHAVAASPDTLAVTTPARDTTGANFLIAGVSNYALAGAADVTDSKGNTWLPLTASVGTVARARLYYAYNATVGSGHTVTASRVDANYPSIAVAAFRDVVFAADPFDVENGATATGATQIQVLVDPTTTFTLRVLVLAFESGDTVTITPSFSITDQTPWVNNANFGVALAWKQDADAGLDGPVWQWSTSDDVATRIAAFNAFAESSGSLFRRSYRPRPFAPGLAR